MKIEKTDSELDVHARPVHSESRIARRDVVRGNAGCQPECGDNAEQEDSVHAEILDLNPFDRINLSQQ